MFLCHFFSFFVYVDGLYAHIERFRTTSWNFILLHIGSVYDVRIMFLFINSIKWINRVIYIWKIKYNLL